MKIDPIYTSKANSILLKEKGFDVECYAYYSDNGNEECISSYPLNYNSNLSVGLTFSRPEHWKVCVWFEKVHGIWVSIDRYEDNKYFYEIDFHSITYGDDDEFDTPYEATEAAINYVLTILI